MRVFLITGFALDKRAFAPLRLPEEVFIAVDLIPIRRGESLREYALRLAAEIGYRPDDVIGGVPLGGMLALEIAAGLGARGIVLIASAGHPRFIRKRFRWLSPLAARVPEILIRNVFRLVPTVLKWRRMLSPQGQALLADIMGKFPPTLLKAMPSRIMGWRGCLPSAPLRQIHSEGDWLIRPNGDPAILKLVKGRNHLLTVSHPEEVREFLFAAVRDFGNQTSA